MVERVECVCPEVQFDPVPVDGEVLRQAKIGIEEPRSAQAVTGSDLESDRTYIGMTPLPPAACLVGEEVDASAWQLLVVCVAVADLGPTRMPGASLE